MSGPNHALPTADTPSSPDQPMVRQGSADAIGLRIASGVRTPRSMSAAGRQVGEFDQLLAEVHNGGPL